MGLRDLLDETENSTSVPGQKSTSSSGGLRSLLTEIESGKIDVDGSAIRRQPQSEIRRTPTGIGPAIKSAIDTFAEYNRGIVEGALPFGLGKRIPQGSYLPTDLVDKVSFSDPGKMAADLSVYTPEVRTKVHSRKFGRLLGDFGRYALVDRIAAGMKLPQVVQSFMSPAARRVSKQAIGGAMAGLSEDVNEDDVLGSLLMHAGFGAVMAPAFHGIMKLGASEIARLSDRTVQATSLREARILAKQAKTMGNEQQASLQATIVKLQARKLARVHAMSDPKLAEEASKIEKEMDALLPKDVQKQKPVDIKVEQQAQVQNMPDAKMDNEIAVLELRASEGGTGAQSAADAAKKLRAEREGRRTEKRRQNIAKARDVKAMKAAATQAAKIPAEPTVLPRLDLSAKSTAGQFEILAAKGTGLVKKLASALQPGVDPQERAATFSQIRSAIDRTTRNETYLGTLPAGGPNEKSRVKWENFFPDELDLQYKRRGVLFDVYAKKSKADVFGNQTNIKPPKGFNPQATEARIAELQSKIEEAFPKEGKTEMLTQYSDKVGMSPVQYAAFLENYLKKNAPSKVEPKITPAQAKQGFKTPPTETPKAREVPVISEEEEFFKSIGATPKPPIQKAKQVPSKKQGGPVMALKDQTTGTVYSDPEATLHVQVLARNPDLKWDNVERGVIEDGVYRSLDVAPNNAAVEALKTARHDIGSKYNGTYILYQLEKRQPKPDVARVAQLETQLKQLKSQVEDATNAYIREVNRQSTQAGFARIGAGGSAGAAEVRPTPPGPEGARPRQFPDKGDINPELITSDINVQEMIHSASTTFDISGKTRGRMSLDEIARLSEEKKNELTLSQILSSTPGTIVNAEEYKAIERIVMDSVKHAWQETKIAAMRTGDDVAFLNGLQSIRQFVDSLTTLRGMRAEAGRLLRVMQGDAAMRRLSTPEAQSILDSMDKNRVISFMEGFTSAIERGDFDAASRQANTILRQPGMIEKLVDLSNMLFTLNPATWGVNFMGNIIGLAVTATERIPIGLFDYGRHLIKGTPRTIYTSEAAAELVGTVGALWKGLKNISKATQFMQPGRVDVARMAENLGLPADLLLQEGAYQTALKVGYLPLTLPDLMFRELKKQSVITGVAHRMALLEGRKGADYATRVLSLINQPTARMRDEAGARSLESTFQQPLGEISRKVQAIRLDPTWGATTRFFIPFWKTLSNLARFIGKRSPLAVFPSSQSGKQLAGKGTPFLTEFPAPTDALMAQSEAYGKVLLGTSFGGMLSWLTLRGMLTGAPPKTALEQQKWDAEGKLPYAFKLGDTWRSYLRIDPLSSYFAVWVTLSEELAEAKADNDLSVDRLGGAILASIGQVYSNLFLRSFTQWSDAFEGTNTLAVSGTLAGRIPGSTQINWVNRTFFDPVIRKAKGTSQAIQQRIPGQSQNLPPRATRITGETFEYSGAATPAQRMMERGLGLFTTGPQRIDSPGLRTMLDLGIHLPTQGASYTTAIFGQVTFTPQEQRNIDSNARKLIRKVLDGLVTSPQWNTSTEKEQVKLIEGVINMSYEMEKESTVLSKMKRAS